MINKIGRYALGLLTLTVITSCAQNTFEWVKINPDKIILAKSRAPYSAEVRQVNLTVALKEKGNTVYYSESDGFFAEKAIKTEVVSITAPLRKKADRNQGSIKRYQKAVPKAVLPISKSTPSKSASPKAPVPSDAEKINSALKIPLNSKALKAGKNVGSFGSGASEIREMAFNDIKKNNPELGQKSADDQQRGKNLMWAGLVLVLLGGVMGFIFGRSAFLISLAGVVFAAIGYFFRI